MIEPGKVWRDTDGKPIQAHSAGMTVRDGVYYWFGENKDGKTDPGKQRIDVIGISCYSSRDLVNWKNEGVVLPAVKNDPHHDLRPGGVLERPKVVYNARTKKYVMWAHIDSADYSFARAGVAVAGKPTGPYTYVRSVRPDGQESRDVTLFQDDDGKAYLIFSSKGNKTLHIALLSEDYLAPGGKFAEAFEGLSREAPAMFKHGRKYFLITSACTGWAPNQAMWAVSDSVLGPWKVMSNPCKGKDAEVTFYAQSTFVLPVAGKPGKFIFLADKWNPKDLGDSRYIWLPLLVSGENIEIPWRDSWDPAAF